MAEGVYDHRGRGLPSTSISEKCGVAFETFLRDDGTGCKGDRRRFRHSHVRRRFAGLKNWKAVCDGGAVAMDFCSWASCRNCLSPKKRSFAIDDFRNLDLIWGNGLAVNFENINETARFT